jgi:hypothetical protein
MTRTEYLRIKAELAAIDDALHEGHLTSEERAKYEALSGTLSKQIVGSWIPRNWAGRSLALGLFLIGLYGLATGLEVLAWCWPFILTTSPRVMGEHFHIRSRHNVDHSLE